MPEARVIFTRLDPLHLAAIAPQESQRLWLGVPGDCDFAQAQILASQSIAWTAWRSNDPGSILACFGISETFPGVQGVAWALLAADLGEDHLALTRFMQREIRECGLARLELLARATDVEPFADEYDPWMLVSASMAVPTPECRWAKLLGLEPAHVLRKFGAAGETYMLFERIG